MDTSTSSVDECQLIWDKIEQSESLLVCSMFDEAELLSSSVIKRLCDGGEAIKTNDMLESAGMVFVQSLNELGRTLDIMKELKQLFGSVTAIPLLVFLTGLCFQIEEGCYDVREFLEEFLSMWRCVDDRYYVIASAEENMGNLSGYDNPFVIGVDKYLEVVEVYAVTLLAKLLKDFDLAISWVEKAELPEQNRQELLRRLQSLYSEKITNSSQANCSPMLADQNRTRTTVKEQNMHEGLAKVPETQNSSVANNGAKAAIMSLARQKPPRFWWFKSITLKIGNGRIVISNGNIVLGILLFFMYYFLRRKQASLKSFLMRQALSAKKAALDLWQLAFSYQVNPLAAVQPLPQAGSR